MWKIEKEKNTTEQNYPGDLKMFMEFFVGFSSSRARAICNVAQQ